MERVFDETNRYLFLVIDWVLSHGIPIIIILIIAFLAIKVTRLFADRYVKSLLETKLTNFEAQKRAETLTSVILYAIKIGVWGMAFVMILGELGIEIGPILAAAGVLGLAVGFGGQTLVQDVIYGFFILLENQIRVGDVVQIAGKAGLVEKVNLRMTVLRDLSGTVHYVRNGEISIVSNMTKDFSFCVLDVGIAYREDVEEVMDLMRKVDEQMRGEEEFAGEILEPLEIFGLDKFADSAVVIRARFKTQTGKQWHVARGFNLRLKKVLDANNVEIPFPHVTLYFGEDKQGQAPAGKINIHQL